jgi:transposase
MDREALEALSHAELVSLALGLAGALAQQAAEYDARIAELTAYTTKLEKRVADLEAKLGTPPKTPNNSSMPPSSGQKPNLPERGRKRRKGRPGVNRALAEHPDRVVEALAEQCPHCTGALTPADQSDVHAYDHIDIPPIRPDVTRINRHRGACPHCAGRFSAPVPEGMEPGSPFGPGIRALVIHLHVTQAISFERLVEVLHGVFGLAISEGAIANMFERALDPMLERAASIGEEVRQATVVASDETSARVCGRKWWQWVLHCTTAVCHVIADTRAASVVTKFLAGARPEVWVADRYAAQNGHAQQRQVCLAHLLRDAQFAIDCGDDIFAPKFKALLKRACGKGNRLLPLRLGCTVLRRDRIRHRHRQAPRQDGPSSDRPRHHAVKGPASPPCRLTG